jgi:hypothetical protein
MRPCAPGWMKRVRMWCKSKSSTPTPSLGLRFNVRVVMDDELPSQLARALPGLLR